MTRNTVLIVLCFFAVALHVFAEEGQGLKPGPEYRELGFYVGNWNATGESRTSPSEEFGKLSGNEKCQWFYGGFAVICQETTEDKNGTSQSIYILTYDANRKQYTVYGTDNLGTVYTGTGKVEYGTWHWSAEALWGTTKTQMKYTFHPKSGGSRTMSIEIGTDDGSWAELFRVMYTPAK